MIEKGATHLGVATDHVIESFRNDLWPDYKTGAGIDPVLWAQFQPLEEALAAMGVVGLADGRARSRRCPRFGGAPRGRDDGSRRCVSGPTTRISPSASAATAWSRSIEERNQIRDAAGVRQKFGVDPALIPDYLALVGDAADGYPGIAGIGAVTAARLINRYGPIEQFPPNVLGEDRDRALLFKKLATLRTDAQLFRDVDELKWRGPTDAFPAWVERLGDARLLERAGKLGDRR